MNSEKINQIKWINQWLRFNLDNSGYNLRTEASLGANWVQEIYNI
jgi:hypothetical protein